VDNGKDIGFMSNAQCDKNDYFTTTMSFIKLSAMKAFVTEKAHIEKAKIPGMG